MKKVLIATAVMLCGWQFAQADLRRGLPRGEPQALATADYGGVDASTWSMNGFTATAFSTITFSPIPNNLSGYQDGVFYGVQFSSGTSTDFVEVWDSTSADASKVGTSISVAGWRFYNINGSTGGLNTNSWGFSGPPKPYRFYKGLIYRPSRVDFNSLNILYHINQ